MPEPTLTDLLTQVHRNCDEAWADVETAAEAGDSQAASRAFGRFAEQTLRHFELEEQELFPALEDAAGLTPDAGPTAVMRAEHAHCRQVLDQMARAAADDDWSQVLDLGDTLLMLVQQHNLKEEQVLYPMADRALAQAAPEMVRRWEGQLTDES